MLPTLSTQDAQLSDSVKMLLGPPESIKVEPAIDDEQVVGRLGTEEAARYPATGVPAHLYERTIAIDVAADPKHLGSRIGITAVLQTWGSTMCKAAHTPGVE